MTKVADKEGFGLSVDTCEQLWEQAFEAIEAWLLGGASGPYSGSTCPKG
jgi:hypothetical protein